MRIRSLAVAAVAVLMAAAPVLAQDTRPVTERTERIGLSGRRGPSLTRPGYAVGEYTGWGQIQNSSRRILWESRDGARAEFNINAPSLGGEVTASCTGGQGQNRILWITWERETLSYDCSYAGAAPAGATLSLALARGSFLGRIQQPQRAAELNWGGVVYRAETRRVGGLPWGGGRVMGYVVSRDGVDVGAIDINGMRPTFYLPPAGSPDRDAVAVFTLTLFFFPDPANNSR